MTRSIALTIAAIFLIAGPILAQTTSARGEFSLQGRLTTSNGSAVANGQHNLTINVYQTGAGTVYTETDVVTTVDGVFSTTVGDNGSGELRFDASANYELGIAVNAEAELSPRLRIGEAPRATTADVALDSKTVGGFSVSADGSAQPNTIVRLDGNGQLSPSILGSSVVTAVNGARGDVNIEGGGNLAVNRNGNTISLSFTGTGSGLNLPFSASSAFNAGQSGMSITSTGAGSAASFVNSSTGTALNVQGTSGSAISASTNASGSAAIDATNTAGAAVSATSNAAGSAAIDARNTAGAAISATSNAAGSAAITATNTAGAAVSATSNAASSAAVEARSTAGAAVSATTNATTSAAITATNTAGAAINATGAAASDAVVRIQNTASGASARLINALDASGNAAFSVAANGQTTIRSTVGNALDVSTSAAGEVALKVGGGLSLSGPIGTGSILANQATVVVQNAHARANSMIFLTVSNAADAVPLRVVSQADGTFTVGLTSALVGTITGAVSFNYLIINQ